MTELEIRNPATDECIGVLEETELSGLDQTIQSAHRAQSHWSGLLASERSDILVRWHQLIATNTERLAQTLTAEQGKPIAEARAEIAYANSFIAWFAAEAVRTNGLSIPSPFRDCRVSAVKEPVGVVCAITPWNFPAAMITRKVAPALAAGCCAIVKPSELTPLTALAITELAYEAGVPKEALVIVISSNAATAGQILSTHPLISKISFTGSSNVGSILMAQAAQGIKRLSLELGGNAPFIVFADADIDNAIVAAKAAKLRNAGQTCVSANRFIVERSIAAEFARCLSVEFASLTLGDGRDPATQMGPMIHSSAAKRVCSLVDQATASGASIIGSPTPDLRQQFIAPIVIENVSPGMRIFAEEIFGPIASVIPFDHEVEAVQLANATEFGLAGYLCSNDRSKIVRVSNAMQCGMIGINTGVISNAAVPFGGCKLSGIGREGSTYGIDEYLEIKTFVEAI